MDYKLKIDKCTYMCCHINNVNNKNDNSNDHNTALPSLPFLHFPEKGTQNYQFKDCNAQSSPLLYYFKIIKIADTVKIENCLLINKYTNNKLLSIQTTSNGKNLFYLRGYKNMK